MLVPFFLGTVAGGIASGRVPQSGNGDPVTSWLNPTSLLGGLAVLACAYTAAVFLTAEARRRDGPELETWFRRRSLVTATAAGAVALAGIAVLHADSPVLFEGLLTRGLGPVVVSGVCGLSALVLLRHATPRPGCCRPWRSWPSRGGAWPSTRTCSVPTRRSRPRPHLPRRCGRWWSSRPRRW
ncbi:cytochrome d ubiquinol oxidase subunit II [Amycolatopsis acidiphila]|uniref:cytochrome d ubiquinol oxidase subunit II n=1 Tax=Amycolatopsis acidiphila TaxID=715473 RepID=UPI001991008F|nr:cytochrome d ubiquinol oxidase subunit II [Amycolatopsis acidiphila]GHG99110.1 hypothetical protein GCM10017788_79530 [Amycolatopsis acidiphila]